MHTCNTEFDPPTNMEPAFQQNSPFQPFILFHVGIQHRVSGSGLNKVVVDSHVGQLPNFNQVNPRYEELHQFKH